MSRLAVALALALLVTPGCKAAEDHQKQVGSDFISKPIAMASAAAELTADMNPVMLDTTNMVYHSTKCPNADPNTMETTTRGSAKARGAKPDPVCFPPAQ